MKGSNAEGVFCRKTPGFVSRGSEWKLHSGGWWRPGASSVTWKDHRPPRPQQFTKRAPHSVTPGAPLTSEGVRQLITREQVIFWESRRRPAACKHVVVVSMATQREAQRLSVESKPESYIKVCKCYITAGGFPSSQWEWRWWCAVTDVDLLWTVSWSNLYLKLYWNYLAVAAISPKTSEDVHVCTWVETFHTWPRFLLWPHFLYEQAGEWCHPLPDQNQQPAATPTLQLQWAPNLSFITVCIIPPSESRTHFFCRKGHHAAFLSGLEKQCSGKGDAWVQVWIRIVSYHSDFPPLLLIKYSLQTASINRKRLNRFFIFIRHWILMFRSIDVH